MNVGVLAVQGNFREHLAMLARLRVDGVEVRLPEQLDGLDGLVIPGGESTAIGRLIRLYGLEQPIAEFPRPIFGTCAGMILLAREAVDGVADQPLLGLIDLVVRRNGYGRQVASFEADIELAGDGPPARGVFIRAPRVVETGPGVEVLGELDGDPVLVRDGRILAAAFHPELTHDTRVHELFLDLVSAAPFQPPGTPLASQRAGEMYLAPTTRTPPASRSSSRSPGTPLPFPPATETHGTSSRSGPAPPPRVGAGYIPPGPTPTEDSRVWA